MKAFKLQVESGEQTSVEFVLREGENILGRSRSVEIQLTAADVSSRHARITVKDGAVSVVNLSQYGTSIGEQKIPGGEPVALALGQLIRVGKNNLRLLEVAAVPENPANVGDTVEPVAPKNISNAPVVVEADNTATGVAGKTVLDELARDNTLTGVAAASDFDQTMRAKAKSADLSDPEDDDSASADKTFAQKTVFAPKEELERRLAEEHAKIRRRNFAFLGGGILLLVLLFMFWPKSVPEGKIEFDSTYDVGEVPAPLGGFKLLYPKNATSKVQTVADGAIVSTAVGRKRDVPLKIRLQESANDKWATQNSDASLREWMNSHPELTFGLPRGKFEGDQNGIWVFSLPYTRTGNEMAVGEVRVFFHGRRLAAIFAEVAAADQGRAENMFKGCNYFEFTPEFEAGNWAGMAITVKLNSPAVFSQINDDLGREAPLTWASIALQLRQILSQSVLENRADLEEQALRSLVNLRQQQTRWYNSQRLLYLNTQRSGDARALAQVVQRGQAVFSDQSDNRYFEVRKW
jgi:hypothetical protein